MAETNFPLAPTFADSMLAPPPVLEEGLSAEEHLQTLKKYLDGQYVSLNKMQNSIASGWLVSTLRVLNLTADTIVADSVFTQDLWIGKDDSTNGYIGLLGTATQIKIVDENGITRFLAGDLGAGVTNWGVQMMNTAGTIIFEAADQVFIDGAVITDATIVNAKIVNSTIDGSTKLANTSVTDAKVASGQSATKMTVGTLTVSSTSVAINVTSGGQVLLSNGADIIFKASASGNTNYIEFRTSGNITQGYIYYGVTADEFGVLADGATMVLGANNGATEITSGGTVTITAVGANVITQSTSGADITVGANITLTPSTVVVVAGNLRADGHKTRNLGTLSLAWAEAYADNFNNVADIRFQNGMVILEADKVYENMAGEVGEFFLLPDKTPGFMFGGDGNLYIKGKIFMDVDFNGMYAQYTPINYAERLQRNAEEQAERQRVADLANAAARPAFKQPRRYQRAAYEPETIAGRLQS